MSDTKRPLGQVTAAGAVWLILQNGGGRVVGFLSQLVIAAILSPQDFGVVGLAFTVSTFGAMLVNFGVDSVLLQRQNTMRFWIVPAFWYSLGLGVAGCLVVVIVGPIAARMYAVPEVSRLAIVIAIGMPLSGLSSVPNVLMRSRFQFRQIAIVGLVETLLIQLLTIGFAMGGLGAYAFVLPLPIVAALRTVTVWYLTRPDLSGLFHKIGRVKYLMNSSLAVFGTGVVQSAVSQGDYIVLGLLANETAVGIYFFAFKMASQPLLMMAMSLSNVLFPALSQLRNTPDAQGAAAFRAARLLGLLIMPLAFLQAGLIEPAIHLFFRSKWDASIPLMQILSIALGFDAIAWIAGTLVTAQGGFRRQFLYILAFSPPFFALVAIGGWHGSALGVAIGVAAYYILVTPVYSYMVFRRNGLTVGRLAWFYLMPAAVACVSIGAAVALTRAIGPGSDILRICLISVLGIGFYTGGLRLADAEAFQEVRGLVSQFLSRLSR